MTDYIAKDKERKERIEKAERDKEKKKQKLHNSLKKVLDTREGLDVYRFLFEITGIFDEDVEPDRRKVGIRLMKELEKTDNKALIKILNKGE